jgi:hypothetical protein
MENDSCLKKQVGKNKKYLTGEERAPKLTLSETK